MIEFGDIKLTDNELPTKDELPGALPEIAEVIGVPLTLKLAIRFQGTPVYFHNLDTILRQHRNKAIRKEYDKGNITAVNLARKYRLSIRRIRDILNSTA